MSLEVTITFNMTVTFERVTVTSKDDEQMARANAKKSKKKFLKILLVTVT